MNTPTHEDPAMHAFMDAPFEAQARQLNEWGEEACGLLILMSGCEGQCFFCAQPSVTHPPASLIPQWSAVEKKLLANRSTGLKHLLIGGTEPPTHPDFERALGLAAECGVESVQLMTSALQAKTRSERWWALGVRSLCTPLYSHQPDLHDAVVGVPGHWRGVVAGLDAAAAQGMTLHLHTLAMRRTLQGVPALAEWVRSRWGVGLSLAPMRPKDALFSYEREAARFGEIKEVVGKEVGLMGFPLCVGEEGEGALLTRLYFRSQRRGFSASCAPCSARAQCAGVVLGHLAQWGDAELRTL